MEALKKAAAAHVVSSALRENGSQVVGESLQTLHDAIFNQFNSLPHRERAAFIEKLNRLAEEHAVKVVSDIVGKGNDGDDDGDGDGDGGRDRGGDDDYIDHKSQE